MLTHNFRHANILSVLAAAPVGLMLMAYAATASANVLGPLVQVSSTSSFGPLEDCGDNPGTPPGDNFLDSEAEPWVVVNPLNPDNIVAMWLQDPWSNGLARGNVIGASFDGGASWDLVPVPGVGDCADGDFDRVVDPWLSFGPDGTLYQISLVANIDPPPDRTAGLGMNALLVSYSVDGGLTWSEPETLIEDPNGVLNDKPSITADPTDADFVYAAWQRFQTARGAVVAPFNPGIAYPFGNGFKGPFYFARSTDGGGSWEPSRAVYDPGGNNVTSGHQILVLPDGTLLAFFGEALSYRNDDRDVRFDFNLSLLRSADKGETWLPKGSPMRLDNILSFGNVTPDDGVPVYGGIFDVAVDSISGDLYAVWQDVRFDGVEAVAFSMSTDGGFTWSAPIKVNQTPAAPTAPLTQQAFVPSVAVNADGVVGVTYYDFRNDDDSGELADHFGVYCSANCSDPASWIGNEARLTDDSFDILDTPFASGTSTGHFVGDYVGLAGDGSDFVSVFAQPHGPGDQDSIFFRRFGPPPP